MLQFQFPQFIHTECRVERSDERVQAAGGPHRARPPDGGGGVRRAVQEQGQQEHDVQPGVQFNRHFFSSQNLAQNLALVFTCGYHSTEVVPELGSFAPSFARKIQNVY